MGGWNNKTLNNFTSLNEHDKESVYCFKLGNHKSCDDGMEFSKIKRLFFSSRKIFFFFLKKIECKFMYTVKEKESDDFFSLFINLSKNLGIQKLKTNYKCII